LSRTSAAREATFLCTAAMLGLAALDSIGLDTILTATTAIGIGIAISAGIGAQFLGSVQPFRSDRDRSSCPNAICCALPPMARLVSRKCRGPVGHVIRGPDRDALVAPQARQQGLRTQLPEVRAQGSVQRTSACKCAHVFLKPACECSTGPGVPGLSLPQNENRWLRRT
jgi:hypothetical protein